MPYNPEDGTYEKWVLRPGFRVILYAPQYTTEELSTMDGRKYDEHLYIVEVLKNMSCSEYYIPLLSVVGEEQSEVAVHLFDAIYSVERPKICKKTGRRNIPIWVGDNFPNGSHATVEDKRRNMWVHEWSRPKGKEFKDANGNASFGNLWAKPHTGRDSFSLEKR